MCETQDQNTEGRIRVTRRELYNVAAMGAHGFFSSVRRLRIWPNLFELGPNSVEIQPILDEFNLADSGPIPGPSAVDSGQHLPEIG